MFKKFWSMSQSIVVGFAVLIITLILAVQTVLAAPLGGNPDVVITNNQAGQTTTYTVSFITSSTGAIGANGEIDVTYPTGFNLAGASLGAISGITGTPSLTINGQALRVMLGASGSVAANASVSITFNTVVNHQTAAGYTVSVETKDSLGATIDGPTVSNSFFIIAGEPSQISINPATATPISADIHSLNITATVYDQYNNLVVNGTAVNWSRSNSAFTLSSASTTTSSGVTSVTLTTATIAGQVTTVTAQSGASTTTATTGNITVIAGALAILTISPSPASQISADTHQINISAILTDQYGNAVADNTVVNWTRSNSSFTLSASSSTTVNGITTVILTTSTLAGDSSTVTAASGTFSAISGIISVVHGATDHLTINPTNIHLANADQSQVYTVSAYDQYNNSWNVSNLATFSFTDPKGSFAGNIYSAGKVGVWQITAQYEGKTVSTNVTIDGPGVPVAISINNPISQIEANIIYGFQVKVYDADGNEISGSSLNWSVIFGTGTGIIDQTGAFEGVLPGTVTVKISTGLIEKTIFFEVKAVVAAAEKKTDSTSAQTTATGEKETIEEAITGGTTVSTGDEEGKIKEAEVTTVGPEPEQAEDNKVAATVVSTILALIILAAAYFGYSYWGAGEKAVESVKLVKPEKAKKKETAKPQAEDIKGKTEEIEEIKEDESQMRW